MPYGTFVNVSPGFLYDCAPHRVSDRRVLRPQGERRSGTVGWGASSPSPIVYMTYHLDWTIFLFAHTVAEVLDLSAFILIFAGVLQLGGLSLGRKRRTHEPPDVHGRAGQRACCLVLPLAEAMPAAGPVATNQINLPPSYASIGHYRRGRNNGHLDQQRSLHPQRAGRGRRGHDHEARRQRHFHLRHPVPTISPYYQFTICWARSSYDVVICSLPRGGPAISTAHRRNLTCSTRHSSARSCRAGDRSPPAS